LNQKNCGSPQFFTLQTPKGAEFIGIFRT